MAKFGKTVRIYLADGTATGIRHAEVTNWTGQAIVCTRARVGELSHWPESQRPGVYMLFGEPDTGTKPIVYVGEAENVLVRLQSHVKNKDFWNQVVFFTNKDENLTKAHVKYLESRIIQLSSELNRVVLENGNAPQLPTLPRSDRDAMEEFLEPAGILLASLGFFILQPLPKKPVGDTDDSNDKFGGPLANTKLKFEVKKTGAMAEGVSTDEGFVVYAGARGPLNILDSLHQGLVDLREELIAQGDIAATGDAIEFVKDVLFKSPSAAAAVICGGSRNGRESWKTKEGVSLKLLEEQLAATPIAAL